MHYTDRYDRIHDDLRVSVTDRCNLRCSYCMPEDPEWFPRAEILSYEELTRLVAILARGGLRKVRITGGEPLARRGLATFVRAVRGIPQVREISLTTNAVLLAGQAAELAAAGLDRVNVSLDTLDAARFASLTRRDAFDRVLEGLAAARAAGLTPVKVNTVLLRGFNEDEVEPLVAWARREGHELRFIEVMPLDNEGAWTPERVVRGEEVRARIAERWPLRRDQGVDASAPAGLYRFVDGGGTVGFIDSVSAPFCGNCNRLRITADGHFRVCLYDPSETDLKTPLRAGASDEQLDALMRAALAAKGRGGALDILERRAAPALTRTMHQIGG